MHMSSDPEMYPADQAEERVLAGLLRGSIPCKTGGRKMACMANRGLGKRTVQKVDY